MDAEAYRKAAHESIDYIIDYYKTLAERPVVSAVSPGYLRQDLPTAMPTAPESWAAIQSDFDQYIMPGLTHWQSPNFLAFFPANTSYPSMLGELYSAAFSAPAFNWICSPAVTELETIVLDWLAKAMNLPECFLSWGEGGGVIQGSASEAVATTMVAARERFLREVVAAGVEDETEREEVMAAARGRLVALASDQTHSSTHKAALIAGCRFMAIPTTKEEEYALTGASLEKALKDCDEKGWLPFFVTASLGTTAVCAVDRLVEVGKVLSTRKSLWGHIDAAYAGAALVCPEICAEYGGGIEYFDSFDVNMHKWLLVNFDASCLYVRRRDDLISALSLDRSYYRNAASASGLVIDYRDWQIPLGRRFRALKIWFVMRSYGLDGLRAHIRRSLMRGGEFTQRVQERSDAFTILATPRFGLTVFRMVGGNEEEADRKTKKLVETVNREGRFFVTGAKVDGKECVRVVAGSAWGSEKALEDAFAHILAVAEAVA
ncbi:pyridoxal phosphate-dependent transferase [Limtongia smithiae]|uniref:pyridoxal phosphate-dependent transferase n=1 Tax=Limtongia smithiae TaxID=1125753 RepID=UPI0034CE278F